MENSIFKNFNYTIIDSSIPNHKEALVTYSYQGQPVRQFFFIREVRGKNNAYYINEAKKIIDYKIENGELVKSSNKLIKKTKKVHSGGAAKPILVTLLALVVATGAGAGGYFLHNYLNGGGGGGGGGGHIPQPGEEVPTDITIDNEGLPEGITVSTGNKPIVGQDYDTTIYLNQSDTANIDGYKLPDTLTKVSYKIGTQETEIASGNYTYDPNSSGDQATLHIGKDYVLGQIDIKLSLVPVDLIALKVSFDSRVKVTKIDGTPVEAGTSVPVKNKNLSLKVEAVSASDEITNNSFNFPNLPAGATWGYDSSTYTLNVNNLTSNAIVNIAAFEKPVIIDAYKGIDTENCTIWDKNHEHQLGNDPTNPTKIILDKSDDIYSYTFKIDVEAGYSLVIGDITISDDTEDPLDYDMTYSNGVLTVSSSEFNTITGIVIAAKAKVIVTPIMAYVSASMGCNVYYGEETEPCHGVIPVYPNDMKQVGFKIEISDGYFLLPVGQGGVSVESSAGTEITIALDKIDATHYSVLLTAVTADFFIHFETPSYPTDHPYALIGEDSKQYVEEDVLPPYFDITTGDSGWETSLPILKAYASTQFAVTVDGMDVDVAEYNLNDHQINIQFSRKIDATDHFVFNLVPPVADPMLTTDNSEIVLLDKDGNEVEKFALPEAGETKAEFYFKFKEGVEHAPAELYEYTISGFYYSVSVQFKGDMYAGTIDFKGKWGGYNLIFHAIAPGTKTVTISEIGEGCTVSHNGKTITAGTPTLVYFGKSEKSVIFNVAVSEGYRLNDSCFNTGSLKSEFNPYTNELIVRGIDEEEFTIIWIRPEKISTKILTSTNVDPTICEISMTSGGGTLSDTPKEYTYSLTTSRYVFNCKLQSSNYAIDSECVATYTDSSGKQGTFYGAYDASNNVLTFSNCDLHSVTSLVITPTLIQKEAINSSATIKLDESLYVDGGVSYNGTSFKDGNTIEIHNSEIKLYIRAAETEIKQEYVTIVGAEGITVSVQHTAEKGRFEYIITISGITDKEFTINIAKT